MTNRGGVVGDSVCNSIEHLSVPARTTLTRILADAVRGTDQHWYMAKQACHSPQQIRVEHVAMNHVRAKTSNDIAERENRSEVGHTRLHVE
jgi:hypothetical protein